MRKVEHKSIVDKRNNNAMIAIGIAMLVLIFLRIALSSRIPAYILSSAGHDDAWCTTRAMYILNGQWLGPYNQYTLIKGVFSPLLMAFSKVIGFTYMQLCTYLYCFSCLFFVYAISPMVQRWSSHLALLVVLLFNPITYATETFQRIYRNGLSQWQLLLIFGGVIAIYLRRNASWKILLPWSILTGLALWAFFNTREDGIWLYPFVIVSILLLLGTAYLNADKKISAKMVVFLLPVIIVFMGNAVISGIQYNVYGSTLINDRDDGYYAKVMKDLYLIEPDPEDDALYSSEAYQDQYYNVYVSTVEKAYEVSPTLMTAKSTIDDHIAAWDLNVGIIGDGQPYADHILFAIRDGVAAAGYYKSLPETEAFYKQVHEELQAAFDAGTLTKRGISLTAMAAPMQWSDIPAVFAQIPKTIEFITSFETVSAGALISQGTPEAITRIEGLVGDRGIIQSDVETEIAGWAILFGANSNLRGEICEADGTPVQSIAFQQSDDVYQHFMAQGLDYEAAKQCRFSIKLNGYDTVDSLIIRIWDENHPQNMVESTLQDILNGSENTSGARAFTNGSITLDRVLSGVGNEHYLMEGLSYNINVANAVGNVYKKLGNVLSVLGLLAYGYLCVTWYRTRKVHNERLTAVVLLLSALLGSFIVFVGAMSYMTVTTFSAQNYMYLSSAYILLLSFCGVSIIYCMEIACEKLRKKKDDA